MTQLIASPSLRALADRCDPFAGMVDDDIVTASAPRMTQEQAAAPRYVETCRKCRGSGRYGRASSYGSGCFACKGAGSLSFASSPEHRAAARQASADRKASKRAAAVAAWRAEHPAAAAWIDAAMARAAERGPGGFGYAMGRALEQWGCLTAGQLAAVERCIAGDAERAAARVAEQAQQDARAEAVDVGALERAFETAKAAGLKRPRITLQAFTFKPASATSRNPGAIYATQGRGEEGVYLGKVLGGRFSPSRECTPETQAAIAGVLADPAAAVKAHGLLTGNCAICSRELTDPESVARGIGPICAERFGWGG